MELAYLLGADAVPFDKLKSTFIIYQGHHGDAGASSADVILPAAAYTEQSGIYVNLEGRPQIAEKAVSPVGVAKEDIEIIKELVGYLKIDIGMDNLQEVRVRIAKEYKVFASIDRIIENKFSKFSSKDKLSKSL